MYTESHVFVKNVYKSAKLFKEGRNRIQDEDRLDRPTILSSSEMVDSVNVLMLANRSATIEHIFEPLGFSVSTAHKIVHDELAFSTVSCWVPKMLTPEYKQKRVHML